MVGRDNIYESLRVQKRMQVIVFIYKNRRKIVLKILFANSI